MGAISVKNEDDVWGASRNFINNIINFGISEVGSKPYLMSFKDKMDYGYNSFEIYTLDDANHSEFIDILRKYLNGGFYIRVGEDEEQGKQLLIELIGRMEIAEIERSNKHNRLDHGQSKISG